MESLVMWVFIALVSPLIVISLSFFVILAFDIFVGVFLMPSSLLIDSIFKTSLIKRVCTLNNKVVGLIPDLYKM